MIKIACDLTTVKCTKDARSWLQKFALPATKLRKNVIAPSAGCCNSLLLLILIRFWWLVPSPSRLLVLVYMTVSCVSDKICFPLLNTRCMTLVQRLNWPSFLIFFSYFLKVYFFKSRAADRLLANLRPCRYVFHALGVLPPTMNLGTPMQKRSGGLVRITQSISDELNVFVVPANLTSVVWND